MSAGKTSGIFMLVEIKNTKLLKCNTYIYNYKNNNNPNHNYKISKINNYDIVLITVSIMI
jgi:hypothetical protein